MIWLYCFLSRGLNMNLIFCDMVIIHCIYVLNYFQNLLTTFRVYFRPQVHQLHHKRGCTEYILQADLENVVCCSMFGQPNNTSCFVHVWALDEVQYTSSQKVNMPSSVIRCLRLTFCELCSNVFPEVA
jgi:hypothetical protein